MDVALEAHVVPGDRLWFTVSPSIDIRWTAHRSAAGPQASAFCKVVRDDRPILEVSMTIESKASVFPGRVRQFGFIVPDLDAELARWVDLGVAPWMVVPRASNGAMLLPR